MKYFSDTPWKKNVTYCCAFFIRQIVIAPENLWDYKASWLLSYRRPTWKADRYHRRHWTIRSSRGVGWSTTDIYRNRHIPQHIPQQTYTAHIIQLNLLFHTGWQIYISRQIRCYGMYNVLTQCPWTKVGVLCCLNWPEGFYEQTKHCCAAGTITKCICW